MQTLGITSKLVSASVAANKDTLSRMTRIALSKLSDNRDMAARAEYLLVKEYISCSSGEYVKMAPMLASTDVDALNRALSSRFYDPSVMETMQCLFRSMLEGNPDFKAKIDRYIQETQQMKRSVNGVAFIAYFMSLPFFVIKYPRGGNSIIHETVAGLYALNPLRAQIPNFSYVYGTFKCGISVPLYTGSVVTCANTEPVDYVVYENIQPSMPASQWVKGCTGKQFLLLYFQTILALNVAHNQCDFTHYDLHANNVLVKSLLTDINITYQLEADKPLVLVTDKIATIIDYGQCHFVHNGVAYGPYSRNLALHGIINRSFPAADAYKFLLSCLYAGRSNPRLRRVGRFLLRFFTTEKRKTIFKNQHQHKWILPATLETLAYRHIDMITYILNLIGTGDAKIPDLVSIPRPPGRKLSIAGNSNPTIYDYWLYLSGYPDHPDRARQIDLLKANIRQLSVQYNADLAQHQSRLAKLVKQLRPYVSSNRELGELVPEGSLEEQIAMYDIIIGATAKLAQTANQISRYLDISRYLGNLGVSRHLNTPDTLLDVNPYLQYANSLTAELIGLKIQGITPVRFLKA